MTMFKSVVNGVALAGAMALLSTSALANGPRHSPQPFSWTGFYAGVNAGYAWGSGDFGSSAGCPDVPNCGIPDPENLAFVSALGTGSRTMDGFTGGIQAGYNVQSGSAVFGVEVDFNALDLGGTHMGTAPFPFGGPTATVTTSIATDWLLTVRGRLGLTLSPNVLAYVTGGLAVTEIKVTNAYLDNSVILGEDTPISGASSNSKTRAGWTVGGGLEWALDRNWTIRGEYLYLDFGSVSTTASVAPPPVFVEGGIVPNTLGTSVDLTAHIARAAVNYKF